MRLPLLTLLLLIICSCGRGMMLPPGVWTETTQTPPAGKIAFMTGVADCPNGPQISVGAAGSFDGGSIRDPAIWKARGKLWILYTAAVHNSAPYIGVSLGLAYTSDIVTGCTGWTKAGQVMVANAAAGQWNSGAIFSPSVFYNPATDDTYVYFSATTSPEQWYSGPSKIGVVHLSPGADYTLPASYVLPAGPLMAAGQSWECFQGVYAPSIVKVGATFNLYYSSSCSGQYFFVGLATATSANGPFTKLPQSDSFNYKSPIYANAHNPLFGDGHTEEPSCSVLDSGQVQCFADDPDGSLGGIGFKAFSSSDFTGQSGWTMNAPVMMGSPQPFYKGHLGAMSQVELAPGTWVMVSNGSPSDKPDAVRSISLFRYMWE